MDNIRSTDGHNKESELKEQRALARLECRVFVHYRTESGNTFRAGLARDISEGGIKFETNKQIPLQTILRLVIQLPLPIRPLKAKAEVVSTSGVGTKDIFEIGAKFLDISERSKEQIARYIEGITSDIMEEEEEIELQHMGIPDEGRVLTTTPAPGRKEKKVNIPALIEEIESLEITIDEEKQVCRLGELATIPFQDLKGCPPLMLGIKLEEAVAEPLLRKYGLDEEEMKKVLRKCKKKFKVMGTSYYIHDLRTSNKDNYI